MENKYSKEIPHGKIEGVSYDLGDIQLGSATSTFDQNTSFRSSDQKDIVRLHFGLKGDYRFSYKQLNQSFDLIGGHFNLMYSPEFDIEVENKTMVIETYGINFSKAAFINYVGEDHKLLQPFIDEIQEGQAVLLGKKWGAIQAPMETLFMGMKQMNYTGDLQENFLLSRSLELLVMAVESLTNQDGNVAKYIQVKKEKEKIIAARDYINERITLAPNLSEVAKAVQLNEYKLKHGFKEIFGTTLFKYLTSKRWHLAQQYLLDSDIPAANIADELGYASPQHFSNMFKKKFGQTPMDFRNNPKNAINVFSTLITLPKN